MTIEIKETLTGSILDIGGGGEAVIGQIYKDRVTAIDNCEEELEEFRTAVPSSLWTQQNYYFQTIHLTM